MMTDPVGVAQQWHNSRAGTGRAGTGMSAAHELCDHPQQVKHHRGASCHAGWFGLGCVFMLVIIYGLLFHARRAAMLRSKKVRRGSTPNDTAPGARWPAVRWTLLGVQSHPAWLLLPACCTEPMGHTAAQAKATAQYCVVPLLSVHSPATQHPETHLQIGATYSALALYLIVLWSIYPIA